MRMYGMVRFVWRRITHALGFIRFAGAATTHAFPCISLTAALTTQDICVAHLFKGFL